MATVLATGLLGVTVVSGRAAADTAPLAPTPATVSADALPTVQQNGVVWSQVTVGDTVYATGSFSQVWPAGTTQGGPGTTTRANLLAFDLTTGQLITTFNHSLNAQGMVITASPDGTRIYVGGDFTTVDGAARNHIAAFNTATGALVATFKPSISAKVRAITATNSTVYAGGDFFSVNGIARTRLAAFAASSGALLSWAPKADDGFVSAMVLAPDRSRVIVGGRFKTLNSVNAYGLGALDASSGASLPFAINQKIRDFGTKCGITSLSADATQIYGSGFAFGCGNFEGTFAAAPDTGKIIWINDCHGDTYSTLPVGSDLYSVGHAHACSAIGAFPDTTPRTWHRALASTTYATGTNFGPDSYGWNYNRVPASSLLHWFPTLTAGSYTGMSQAAWSVTGNSKYIALGGEFPTVNGKVQRGLVRFAIASIAPDKTGPMQSSTLTPTVTSVAPGAVRVSWTATWDPDNANLTYQVFRDGGSTPIATLTQQSTFWTLPAMGFEDTGLPPGSAHTYRIRVVDPNGNAVTSASSGASIVSATALRAYASAVIDDGAVDYWRLGESGRAMSYDWAGFANLTTGSGVSRGVGGAIDQDSDAASEFDGTAAGTAATDAARRSPKVFTVEAWINTTTSQGGKIIGFGNAALGSTSIRFDRHIYMDNAGHLVFGVSYKNRHTISSPGTYNDGQWHLVAAALSKAGMALYVDGAKVAQDTATTTAGRQYTGYWRLGGDSLAKWPAKPTSAYFRGAIDDAAVYPRPLSLRTVQKQFIDSGRPLTVTNQPPTAAASISCASLACSVDATKSSDDDAITSYSWDFGDGSQGSGMKATHTYAAAGDYPVTLTVDDAQGATGTETVEAVPRPPANPATATVATDNFRRTVTNGWGTAQTGGVWTGHRTKIGLSVRAGAGRIVAATAGPVRGALLDHLSLTDTDSTVTWSVNKRATGIGTNLTIVGRHVTATREYRGTIRLRPNGSVMLSLLRSGGASGVHVIARKAPLAGLAYRPGMKVKARLQVSGIRPTILRFKVWRAGRAQPKHWQLTATDANHALQTSGSVGLTASRSGKVEHGPVTVASRAYSVRSTAASPTAVFSIESTVLAVSADAAGSRDPTERIKSYTWSWGDGAITHGPSSTHSYAVAGTYTVTLTVTDPSGRTAVRTHSVTVTP